MSPLWLLLSGTQLSGDFSGVYAIHPHLATLNALTNRTGLSAVSGNEFCVLAKIFTLSVPCRLLHCTYTI